MKIEELRPRDKSSVCAGAFHLLRGRASAQLRAKFDYHYHLKFYHNNTRQHQSVLAFITFSLPN